jgi:aromatic-L-amino-acid/L-tryptophan decarboxylase
LGFSLAAIDGSNLGGRNAAPTQMDRQVVNWFNAMMGFPESSSPTLTSGDSIANTFGPITVRNAMAGVDVRA